MTRWIRFVPVVMFIAGCGDLKFDENLPTSPGGSPPGSTTSLGSTSAMVDNQRLTATLQTPAIWRNGSFGFSGLNVSDNTKILAVSLRLPGPGTYNTGDTYSPVISYLEQNGQTTYRWFMTSSQGSGSVTVSFLSNESASGYFNGELLPDSATMAAGFLASRFITDGSFSVSVMR